VDVLSRMVMIINCRDYVLQ